MKRYLLNECPGYSFTQSCQVDNADTVQEALVFATKYN